MAKSKVRKGAKKKNAHRLMTEEHHGRAIRKKMRIHDMEIAEAQGAAVEKMIKEAIELYETDKDASDLSEDRYNELVKLVSDVEEARENAARKTNDSGVVVSN